MDRKVTRKYAEDFVYVVVVPNEATFGFDEFDFPAVRFGDYFGSSELVGIVARSA